MYTRDNNTCEEFENVIKDLTINPTVQKMKEFRQHYNTSCYEHCLNVAFYSYLIAKKLNLDYKAIARGAMLIAIGVVTARVANAIMVGSDKCSK